MHAVAALRDLVAYRALLVHLAGVQFRTRYHSAILGVAWTLVTPLALFVIFTTIFQPIFEIKVENYGLWLLAALFPWTCLNNSVLETVRALQANATFIKANTFPREVLPLAGVLVQLANLLLALTLVVIWAAATIEGSLSWRLALLPLALLLLVVFTSGLCLILSALDAVYKDVRYMVEVVMLGWFFLTPIFYPAWKIEQKVDLGVMKQVVLCNPMTPIVDFFRFCILPNQPDPDPVFLGGAALFSLLLFVFGLSQFRRLVDKYVDLL